MVPRRLLPAIVGFLILSCSGSSGNSPDASGASSGGSSGGTVTSSGGVRSSGGATTTSSMGGAAGGSHTGNTSSVGGSTAVGGTNATGGTSVAAGGSGTSASSAGSRSAGRTGSGGTAGLGGSARSGGSVGRGGNASTGGQSGAGGSASGCAYAPPSGSPVATHGQLKVVGTRVQNESGQPVQLKGVSSFWLNWENPKYAESKSAVQYMRDNWKIQIIRVAMGIEVTDGYLSSKSATQARVDTIVQNAHSLGLYVIVDWHTEHAVEQTSESVAFFTNMADKYGKCPNIIYEDYNEPTNVTWDRIKPYHEAVVKAIRAKDPDNLIILGTPDWSSKPDVAAANPVAGTNLLYTLHFYSCAHAASSRAVGETAMSKGVALFISEFGLTPADGGVPPNNKVCESEGKQWFDWMAKNGISGTAWKLVSGVDSSNIFSSTNKPPVDGPFPDSALSQTTGSSPGHGQVIVNWLRD
jgi:hypothetical protein